jgi:hypothetical protein
MKNKYRKFKEETENLKSDKDIFEIFYRHYVMENNTGIKEDDFMKQNLYIHLMYYYNNICINLLYIDFYEKQ